jgi:hypothetical protein
VGQAYQYELDVWFSMNLKSTTRKDVLLIVIRNELEVLTHSRSGRCGGSLERVRQNKEVHTWECLSEVSWLHLR